MNRAHPKMKTRWLSCTKMREIFKFQKDISIKSIGPEKAVLQLILQITQAADTDNRTDQETARVVSCN